MDARIEKVIPLEEFHKKIIAEKLLFQLIKDNDIENLKILVQCVDPKPNINTQDKDNNTPLLLAMSHAKREIAKILIDAKANIHEIHANGEHALTFAVKQYDEELVKILLEKKTNVNHLDKNHSTPLIHALKNYCKPSTILMLLEAKANPNQIDKDGYNSLHLAIKNKIYPCDILVKMIIDAKANVHIPNGKGNTALIIAASERKPKCVKLLIDAKANPNTFSIHRDAAIQFAILQNDLESIKILAENKADISINQKYRLNQLLLRAVQKSAMDSVKILLDATASPDASDNLENSALHYAASLKNSEILKTLLDAKAFINTLNIKNTSPLAEAVFHNLSENVMILLHANADPDFGILKGNPLFIATKNNNHALMQTLIDAKADIDNSYAIHSAVNHRSIPALQILLEAKANVDTKHIYHGKQALFDALENPACVKLLLDYKSDPNMQTTEGNTPLIEAVKLANILSSELPNLILTIQALLEAKANPFIKNNNEQIAAHFTKNKTVLHCFVIATPKWYEHFFQKQPTLKKNNEYKNRISINN